MWVHPRRTYVRRDFCEAQKIGVKSLVKSVLKSLTTRFVWDKRKKAVMCPRVNLFRSPTQFPKSGPHTKCMKRDSAHTELKIGVRMVTRPFAKCFTLSRRLRNTQSQAPSRMRPLWGHNSDGKVESCHPYPLIGVGGSSQIFPRFGRT